MAVGRIVNKLITLQAIIEPKTLGLFIRMSIRSQSVFFRRREKWVYLMNCLTTSPQWKRLPKLLNMKDPRIVQYQKYSSGRIPRSTHPSSRHQRMVMLLHLIIRLRLHAQRLQLYMPVLNHRPSSYILHCSWGQRQQVLMNQYHSRAVVNAIVVCH